MHHKLRHAKLIPSTRGPSTSPRNMGVQGDEISYFGPSNFFFEVWEVFLNQEPMGSKDHPEQIQKTTKIEWGRMNLYFSLGGWQLWRPLNNQPFSEHPVSSSQNSQFDTESIDMCNHLQSFASPSPKKSVGGAQNYGWFCDEFSTPHDAFKIEHAL